MVGRRQHEQHGRRHRQRARRGEADDRKRARLVVRVLEGLAGRRQIRGAAILVRDAADRAGVIVEVVALAGGVERLHRPQNQRADRDAAGDPGGDPLGTGGARAASRPTYRDRPSRQRPRPGPRRRQRRCRPARSPPHCGGAGTSANVRRSRLPAAMVTVSCAVSNPAARTSTTTCPFSTRMGPASESGVDRLSVQQDVGARGRNGQHELADVRARRLELPLQDRLVLGDPRVVRTWPGPHPDGVRRRRRRRAPSRTSRAGRPCAASARSRTPSRTAAARGRSDPDRAGERPRESAPRLDPRRSPRGRAPLPRSVTAASTAASANGTHGPSGLAGRKRWCACVRRDLDKRGEESSIQQRNAVVHAHFRRLAIMRPRGRDPLPGLGLDFGHFDRAAPAGPLAARDAAGPRRRRFDRRGGVISRGGGGTGRGGGASGLALRGDHGFGRRRRRDGRAGGTGGDAAGGGGGGGIGAAATGAAGRRGGGSGANGAAGATGRGGVAGAATSDAAAETAGA